MVNERYISCTWSVHKSQTVLILCLNSEYLDKKVFSPLCFKEQCNRKVKWMPNLCFHVCGVMVRFCQHIELLVYTGTTLLQFPVYIRPSFRVENKNTGRSLSAHWGNFLQNNSFLWFLKEDRTWFWILFLLFIWGTVAGQS